MLAEKHVRHDWQQFLEFEQRNVRTLCGVNTAMHNAGIPGITDWDRDWCPSCARGVFNTPDSIERLNIFVAEPLKALYRDAYLAVYPAMVKERKAQIRRAIKRNEVRAMEGKEPLPVPEEL